jgi:hypothetical protein
MAVFFVSYSEKDKSWAELVARILEGAGHSVYFASRDSPPGSHFLRDIDEAVERADKMIAVLSENYLHGKYTRLEWEAALAGDPEGRQRKLILVRVGECQPTGLLRGLVYVDWVNLPEADRSRILLDAVSRHPESVTQAAGVVPDNEQSPSHRRLLRDLERSIADGDLEDSDLAPNVLAVLAEESGLELERSYDAKLVIRGILASDEHFLLVRGSAGERDWQMDFAQMATPVMVAMAQSLARSADAQAALVRLCEGLAEGLRLTVVWPENAATSNDLKNAIYAACRRAKDLPDDEVLMLLRGLTILGPV